MKTSGRGKVFETMLWMTITVIINQYSYYYYYYYYYYYQVHFFVLNLCSCD